MKTVNMSIKWRDGMERSRKLKIDGTVDILISSLQHWKKEIEESLVVEKTASPSFKRLKEGSRAWALYQLASGYSLTTETFSNGFWIMMDVKGVIRDQHNNIFIWDKAVQENGWIYTTGKITTPLVTARQKQEKLQQELKEAIDAILESTAPNGYIKYIRNGLKFTERHVCIPLPNANNTWTNIVFNLCMQLCKKFQDMIYPEFNPNYEYNFLHINYSRLLLTNKP